MNRTLSAKGCKVSRTMRKKTFQARGIAYCGELALKNLKDTQKIMEWNVKNNIYVYRISSGIFPWISEYRIHDLPMWPEIKVLLQDIGEYIQKHSIRVSMHPGHFTIIASEKPETRETSIRELDGHNEILSAMGLPATRQYPINIHINQTRARGKRDLDAVAKRFSDAFFSLDADTQSRLVVENDDKKAQWGVELLYNKIWPRTGCSITMDFFHFKHGPDTVSIETAWEMVKRTWKYRPLTHASSSRKIHENADARVTAHADLLYEKIPFYKQDVFDVEIEAKAKELALIDYCTKY